ncbi:MAG: glycosyltransferase family 2 protein [Chloroflexota bacterium]
MNNPSAPALVSIIVLAYNGQAYLRVCLEAVCRQDYPNFETIVVDNASRDGSAVLVRRDFPGVQLVENRRNLGFAGGNNLGMRLARGEIIVLLNHDTVVEPTWLSELVKAVQSDPAIGIAGCKIYNPDGRTLQHAGGWFLPNGLSNHYGRDEVDQGQYEQPRPVEYVTGAALAIRRQVIERCGGLDPGYFPAYFEEADWCLRARKAGYQVVYAPAARLVHHESVWSSVTSPRFLYTYHKNRLRFVLKNYTRAQLAAAVKFEIGWLRRYKPPRVLWLAYLVNLLRLPLTLAARWRQPNRNFLFRNERFER